jgi:hypothetical protein
MGIRDILLTVNDETKTIISGSFDVELNQAFVLPSIDDQGLTFEDFDTKSKKAKFIETCALHIDLRHSTKLNIERSPLDLSKLYSCFIRGVIKCAEFYGGETKNIVGDRVLILFSPERCFENAVNSAILLNTFTGYILNRHFKNAFIKCGIGIDFGKMLVAKVGTIKQGKANPEYKSLVWLGRPANIASKLADIANHSYYRPVVRVGKYFPLTDVWHWSDKEIHDFFNSLEMTYSYPIIAQFKEPYIQSFFKSFISYSYSPILITDRVYNGFRQNCPTEPSIVNRWWKVRKVSISGYSGTVYEGDIHFTFAKSLE